jgi:cytochrome P450
VAAAVGRGSGVLCHQRRREAKGAIHPHSRVTDAGDPLPPHGHRLGAWLARLELRIVFEELLRRLPAVELAGPVTRMRSYFLSGLRTMPVRRSA